MLHLVNNAGMIEVAGIEAVTQDALARTMAVNLVAPVVLLQALLPACARPATDEWSTSAAAPRWANLGARPMARPRARWRP